MANRINGDFDQESIEAFRAAYANQILSPEEQEIDQLTGLPTNLVLNTSPWIQHTGLWKANDGTDKNFVPNQVLVPGEEEDEEDLSEEDLDEIIQDLLDEVEAEEIEETLESIRSNWSYEDDEDEGEGEDLEGYEDTDEYEDEEEEISDEEIDELIAELEAELEG